MGVEVRKAKTEELQPSVDRLVTEEGYLYCHSFDDPDLIAGYGRYILNFFLLLVFWERAGSFTF